MAGKTAVLSVRIVSDSKNGVAGLMKTAAAVTMLDKAAKRSGSAMAGIAKSAPKIATVAASIASLTAAAGAGVGSITAIGAGLWSMGGAALALPAMLAATAVGGGVLFAALKDIGTVLEDLGPRFGALQDSISSNYWAKAEGPIRNLVDSVLPTLDTALSNTATIMGTGMAIAADTLRASLSGALGPMLSDINTGFHNANAGMAPFVEGLVELTRVGSTYLPGMGAAVAGIGQSFGAWVAHASETGRLNELIETGATAIGQLGSALADMGGILGGVATAAMAAGSGGLGAFAEGLDRANAAVNGPAFQGALTTFFEGAYQGVSNLGPGVAALGDAFAALTPTLAEVMALGGSAVSALVEGISGALSSPALSGGLEQAFNGILLAAQTLSPAITALGPLVGQVAATFGTLIAAVAPLVAQLVSALAPALTAILAAVTPLATQLVSALAPVFTMLATQIIPMLIPVLMTVVQTLGTVVTAVAPLVAALVTALVPAIQAVLPIVQTVFNAIGPIITAALTVITGALTMLTGILTGDWAMAWEGAKQVVSGAWDLIKSVITGALSVIGAVISAKVALLKTVWSGGWNAMKSVLSDAWAAIRSAVISGIAAVVSGVSSGMSNVVSFMSSAWSRAQALVSTAWSMIRSAVASGISGVMSFVGSLPGRIVGALSSLGSQLYNVGINMMQGMVRGISAMAGNLISAARGAVSGAISAAKNLLGIHSPSRVFKKFGMQTGQGFVLGLEGMKSDVKKATKGILDIPNGVEGMKGPELNLNAQGARGNGSQAAGRPEIHIHVQSAIVDQLGFQEAVYGALRQHDRLMGVGA